MCRCGGCNGGQNSVRFNPDTGQLEYNNNGTWTLVPEEAIPGNPDYVPPEDPDNPPEPTETSNPQCWKAHGAWSAIFEGTQAFLDVLSTVSLIETPIGAAWRMRREYPDLSWEMDRLVGTLNEHFNSTEAAETLLAYLTANEELIREPFICALQHRVNNSSRLSDSEITWIKAYEWSTGNAQLDEILSDVTVAITSAHYKGRSYRFVQAQEGTCSCDGSQPRPTEDELEPGCYIYDYVGSACPYTGAQRGLQTPASLQSEGDCGGFGSFSGGQLTTTGIYTTADGGKYEARGEALFELVGEAGLELLGVTVAYDFSGTPGVTYREIMVNYAISESANFGGDFISPTGNSGTHFFNFTVNNPFPAFLWLGIHANFGTGEGSTGVAKLFSATLHLRKAGVEFTQVLTLNEFCPPEAP